MLSSVVSLKRGVHAFMLLSLVCLLAAPGMADTVTTPVRQYGYSYGFPMSGIAALSPDGSQFAMASGATVRIVDTDTGLPVRTLSGHLQTVTAVAWSADGTRIASGSDDLTARVWDAETGEHICTTSQPRGEVISIALSGDGSRLITGTASTSVGGEVVLPGAAYLWDGTTGVLINGLGHAGNVSAVAFSPDGAYAATGSSVMFPDDERVYGAAYLWNLGTMSGTLITRNPVVDPPPAPVPDVVGLQQAAAETAITGASLSVGTVTGSWSATVPVGEVMSQSPPAVVAWVLPGTRVDMEVSMGPEPVMVPIAVGRQRSVVETVLTGAGLAVGTVTESWSATVPVGYVMSQDPAARTPVPAGSAVALEVSKGPEPVRVPNVVGMTQAEATTALLAAPLTLGTVTEAFSATVAAGQVISQNPAVDAMVSKNTPVDITVSKGPASGSGNEVPNVVGRTRAAAETALTDAGLAVGTVTEPYSATVPAGQVISQDPLAGALVAANTPVNLVVSKGPAPVAVPNVGGMTQAQAATALLAAPLTLGTVTEAFSATVAAGRVISQNPAAGATRPKNTPVNLEVSKGPAPVAVPNVVGRTQAAAATALTGAGLAVGVVTEAYSETVPAGQVISQNLLAGAMVAVNTPVNLVVSKGPVPVPYTQWGPVRAVAFAAGNRVITGGSGGDAGSSYWEACVWRYTTANPPTFTLDRRLRPLVSAGGRVSSLVVSGSGILAVGLSTGEVRRWDLDGTTNPSSLNDHSGEVKSVCVSADSSTTFVASADGFASQWQTSTGRLLRSGHRGPVNAVAFSPDGSSILTGSADNRAFTWETGTSIEQRRLGSSLFGHLDDVMAAVYSADGGRILTGSSDTTGKLWDSGSGADLRTFMWHGLPVNSVAFSPDGLTVVTGSSDLQAKLWDAGTGVLLQTFTGHSAEVTSVAFSPDGLTLATGSADTTARLWDVASGEPLTTLSGHTGPVRSVVFSPDGTRVLTGARSFPTGAVDNTARLWDTGTGSVLHIFVGHSLGVTSVAFSPDGFQALTGSRDGSAIIWDTQSGVELRRYTGHVGEVTSVAFSPTERRIVTGSTDRVARLWEGLVVVPNVVGLVQATAESTLAAATLYAGPITEAYDNTIPAGSVASQDPAAGTGVSAGSPVALVVSLGPAPVTVPDVVGMTRVEAQTALSGVNLVEGDVTQQYSDTVPAGEVISQDPAAGTEVLPGTAVNLVVSLGAEPVMVPNVVGLLQAGATAAITGAGFEVGVVTQQYDPAPAGTVIAQSPLGGTMAPPGTPVSLVVSRGPQPLVNVPNIVGLTVGDAAAALLAADLTAGTFTEQHSATVPAGRVISQNPPAGAQALAGAPVDAAISLGPQPVPVPNVVGMTQEAAATAILGAGLVVGTVTREPSATVPAGSVIRQDPEGGAEALPGSPVNLVISEPEPVEVPNLVGRPQATANTLITSAGLVVGTVTEEYSATVLAGRVIRQNPEAGEEVDPGSPVDLVVSRGPEPVTMPNLVGKTRTAAQGLLAAVQLREGSVTYEYSDTVARDIVLSQAKTPGSEVPAGTAVDFAVSRGVAPGVVPDIVGELRSDAEADIVAAGLAVGEVTERYDDNVRKDRVIRQTPAAGTELATGSPVSFVVSLGKEPAETSAVPNVVNTPSTSARAAIASAGFVVGAVTEKYDDVIPAGWVIAQSPAGGEERAAGTPVDLVVSLGKYLGPDADEARALLAALFDDADTDGDGKLSWEEALAAVPSLSRAVFDELDTNTDGYLDRTELGLPEEGCGACGCQKGDMTPGGLKQRLGDLFLSALALSVLAAFGRRGR